MEKRKATPEQAANFIEEMMSGFSDEQKIMFILTHFEGASRSIHVRTDERLVEQGMDASLFLTEEGAKEQMKKLVIQLFDALHRVPALSHLEGIRMSTGNTLLARGMLGTNPDGYPNSIEWSQLLQMCQNVKEMSFPPYKGLTLRSLIIPFFPALSIEHLFASSILWA